MLCCEISSLEEELLLLLLVLSLVRSHFPGYVAKHRERNVTRKRARGDCATWESVLNFSLVLLCLCLPAAFSKCFLQVFGGGRALL